MNAAIAAELGASEMLQRERLQANAELLMEVLLLTRLLQWMCGEWSLTGTGRDPPQSCEERMTNDRD